MIVRLPLIDTSITENVEDEKFVLNKKTRFYKKEKLHSESLINEGENKNNLK